MKFEKRQLKYIQETPYFPGLVEERIAKDPAVGRLLRFYLDNRNKKIPSEVLEWTMDFVDSVHTVPAHLLFTVEEGDATEREVFGDLFQLVSLLDFPTVEISVWMNSSSYDEFLNQRDTRKGTVRYYPREEARRNFDLFAKEFFAVLNQNHPLSDPGISEKNVWSFKKLKIKVYDTPEHIIRLATSRDTKRFANLELYGYSVVEAGPPTEEGWKQYRTIFPENPNGSYPYVKEKNREIYRRLERAVREGIFSYETLARYEIMTQLGGESL